MSDPIKIREISIAAFAAAALSQNWPDRPLVRRVAKAVAAIGPTTKRAKVKAARKHRRSQK